MENHDGQGMSEMSASGRTDVASDIRRFDVVVDVFFCTVAVFRDDGCQ